MLPDSPHAVMLLFHLCRRRVLHKRGTVSCGMRAQEDMPCSPEHMSKPHMPHMWAHNALCLDRHTWRWTVRLQSMVWLVAFMAACTLPASMHSIHALLSQTQLACVHTQRTRVRMTMAHSTPGRGQVCVRVCSRAIVRITSTWPASCLAHAWVPAESHATQLCFWSLLPRRGRAHSDNHTVSRSAQTLQRKHASAALRATNTPSTGWLKSHIQATGLPGPQKGHHPGSHFYWHAQLIGFWAGEVHPWVSQTPGSKDDELKGAGEAYRGNRLPWHSHTQQA